MPTSITLKNIPDAIYARLKHAAELNRRSLNSEALVWLEFRLNQAPDAANAHQLRAQQLRAELPASKLSNAAITKFKNAGRK